MPVPVNPLHRILLEDGTSYLLEEDNASKIVLDEYVALDNPLNAGTVSSLTPALTFAGESSIPSTNWPVAYYSLEGNSTDSIGSFNGTDTAMSYVSGKIGKAGSFNGTSSYIDIGTVLQPRPSNLVAHTSGVGTSSSVTTSPSINTTGANLIIIGVSFNTGATPTLTDTYTNTWTPMTARAVTSNGTSQMYYCYNPTVGAGHTFTNSTVSGFSSLTVQAWSGADSAPLDQTNGATNASSSTILAAVTPTLDSEIIVSHFMFSVAGTASVNSSMSITDQVNYSGSNNYGGALAYVIGNNNELAVNPTWTSGGGATGVAMSIASFKVKRVASSDFTFAAWVNPNNTASTRTIVGSGVAGAPQFRIEGDNNLGLIKQNVVGISVLGGVVPIGGWSHVAVTYDVFGNYQFYINGAPSANGTTIKDFSFADAWIGSQVNGSEFYSGGIDEVGIWHEALRPDQIASLYNAGAGRLYGPSPLTYEVEVDTVNTFDSTVIGTAQLTPAIVQHQAGTANTSDVSGNTAATAWPGNTASGHLLLAALTFNGSATVTCGTAGWAKATSVQNGGTAGGASQTDIWYKENSAGTDASPVFVITASIKYIVNLTEVSGIALSSSLDKTGTNSVSNGASPSSVTVAVSAPTTDSNEFVYGVAGVRDGSSSINVTWTLPSTGSNQTFQADLDSLTASAISEGMVHSWGLSGASGTSPSFTFTSSGASAAEQLAYGIATFKAQTVNVNGPLLDKTSDVNLGFYDSTGGETSDPKILLEASNGGGALLLEDNASYLIQNEGYASGDYLTYQLSTTLTNSTTYYWRVRSKIANGAYGVWSDIRSFLVSSGTVHTSSLSATLNLAGVDNEQTNRTVTANLSFIGAITRRMNDAGFTATLNFAGGFTKRLGRTLTGSLSFVGTFLRRLGRPVSGTLSFVGSVKPAAAKLFTPTLSFVGSVTRAITRPLTGTLSFIGNTTRSIIRTAMTGTVSFTGGFARRLNKSLSGTLSFVGLDNVRTSKAVSGTLNLTGTFNRRISHLLTGSLSFIGNVARLISYPLTATLSFVGDFTSARGIHNFTQSLSGSLSFIGSTTKTTGYPLSGSLSFVGVFSKIIRRPFSGSLSFVGSISTRAAHLLSLTANLSFVGATNKAITHSFTATASFVGTFSKTTRRALTGTVSFVGTFSRQIGKSLSGSLSFIGSILRTIFRPLTATLNFAGSLLRRITHSFTGAVSFSGSMLKSVIRSLSGSVSFVGTFTKGAIHLLSNSGSLSFVGASLRVPNKALAGTVSSSGAITRSTRYPLSASLGLSSSSGGGAATIQQTIEMLRGSWGGSGTANTYLEIPGVATKYNSADFDGTVTTYFEVNMNNGGTSGQTAYAQLYNHTDSVAVTGSEVTVIGSSGSFPLRVRSSAITLSGDKIYTVQLKHSNTSTLTTIYAARIIVQQSGNITKTQVHQELGAELGISSTSNTNIPVNLMQFLYESSKYDGSVTIRHDAVLKTSTGNTSTSGIYDVTASSIVTGSEVSLVNNTTHTIVSSGNITLTDGHVYQPTEYVSAGAATLFESNKLVFTITGGFTKFLAYMQTFNQAVIAENNATSIYPTSNVFTESYTSFNPSLFSGVTLTTYHEGLLKTAASGNTAYMTLEDYVYATSASDITGSVISHTGDTLFTRVRSSSFIFPSGAHDIVSSISSDIASNGFFSQGYLIIEVTNLGQSGSGGLIKSTMRPISATLNFAGSMVISGSAHLISFTASALFSGAFIKRVSKTFTATGSFSGSLTRLITYPLTATLSFSGSFAKRIARNLSGTISFTGSFLKQIIRPLTASITFSGSFTKRITRSLSGSVSFSGSMTKLITYPLTATLNFVGSFSKVVSRSLSATLNFVGTFVSGAAHAISFTGSLTFTGNLIRRIAKSLTANLSFVGSLTKIITHSFTATVSFVGNFSKRIARSLTGAVSFSGSLLTGAAHFLALTASLTFSGTLIRRIIKSLSGTASFSGSITKRITYPLTGTLNFTGSITKRITHTFTASVSFVGSFVAGAAHFLSLSGTLNFSGSLVRRIGRSLTASLNFSGSVLRRIFHSLTGTLNLSGTTGKRITKSVSGSVSFSGSVFKRIPKSMTGSVSFTGGFARQLQKSFTATLGTIGSFISRYIPATAPLPGKTTYLSEKSNEEAITPLSTTQSVQQFDTISDLRQSPSTSELTDEDTTTIL